MDKSVYLNEFDKIELDWIKYQHDIIHRTRICLISACDELGDFFLSKNFIITIKDEKKYYYDPKSKIGIAPEPDKTIYLDTEYNSVSAKIIYKAGNNFIEYDKKVFYKFKEETPEQVYIRVLKYTKNQPLYNMKAYLRKKYPEEMLIVDRIEKIKTINLNK